MLPAWIRRNPMARALVARLFPIFGSMPDSPFYNAYKERVLAGQLKVPFEPDRLPVRYGRWLDERVVEYPWFFSQLPVAPGRLLDAGSVLNHDLILRQPKLANKEVTIMTLAPEDNHFDRPNLHYVYGDLRKTSFSDGGFDTVVSLSTIEHIGLDNTLFYTSDPGKAENNPRAYLEAIGEFRRVLKPGGVCLISVPYGKAVVRRWVQVFDGKMVDSIVEQFAPQTFVATYFHYSASAGWQLSTREAAKDAVFFDVHNDQAWPGAPASAQAVACLAMTKPRI